MSVYKKIKSRSLYPAEQALYSELTGKPIGAHDWKAVNEYIDSLNAKEQGVQPTPSSATGTGIRKGTFLEPDSPVTAVPYSNPYGAYQQGKATAKMESPKPKVDPVRAKLQEMKAVPTLDQAQITQNKTLQEKLQGAAYQADAKLQYIGAPASAPDVYTKSEYQAHQKQLAEKAYKDANPTEPNGFTNPIDEKTGMYKPISRQVFQQQLANNEIKLDDKGFAYLPIKDETGKLKWATQPAYKVDKNGYVQPARINPNGIGGVVANTLGLNPNGWVADMINTTGTVAGIVDPFTRSAVALANGYLNGKVSQKDLRKSAEANPTGMGSAFMESLVSAPISPADWSIMAGIPTPEGSNPSKYEGARTAGKVVQGIALSAGTGLGFARAGITGWMALAGQAGTSIINNWNQLAPSVQAGDISLAQGMGLTAAYAIADAASIKLGNTVNTGIRTLANVPKYAPIIAELGTQAVTDYGTTLGISYVEMKARGMNNTEAWEQANKIAAITGAMSLSFGVAFATAPMALNKGYSALLGYKLDEADANGSNLVTIKSDELPDVPAGFTDGVEAQNALKQTVAEAGGELTITPAQAEAIMSPEVKAGNAPEAPVEVKPTVPEPDIPTIKEIVTKINTDGLKPEGKLAKEWAAGFKDTELTAVKEGDTPTAEDKKSKITFARQAEIAATMIFGEKVPVGGIFDMLNTNNLPVSATIKDSFDNSVHDKIINGEPFSQADVFVGQVELKNVTDDVLNRVKRTFPDNWLEKTIGMYSIAGSKKIEDALFDFYKNDTFPGTDGKAIPATLKNIEIDADTKMRQVANTAPEMIAVENMPSALLETQRRNAEFADQTGATPQEIIEYKLENRQRLTPEELRIANDESFLPEGYKYDKNTNLQPTTSNMSTIAKPEALQTNNNAVPAPEYKATLLDEIIPTIEKYGWTANTIQGTDNVVVYNRNNKPIMQVAYSIDKKTYGIYDGDKKLLLKGNKDINSGIDKVAKQYFYAKEEPITPKPEEVSPPEAIDVPLTDDQLDAMAMEEIAIPAVKAKKGKKTKKVTNSTNLTNDEIAALDNMSKEEIDDFYLTKNKDKWKKEFDLEEEYNPAADWNEFVSNKIDEAYLGTMLRTNYTQAGVGVALMLPELFSDENDSDDPNEAGWTTAAFIFGMAALGAGTVRYVKYRANQRARIANEKLGYRPEAPKSIIDSRAVKNPDLYFPGKTPIEVMDIANKASKVQDAVIPRAKIFRNSDANIFLNTDAILRDHPQYQGIPWGADPRVPYEVKFMEEQKFVPYKNMVIDAEHNYKKALKSIPVPGLDYYDKGATIFRYNWLEQSDVRNASHLPKSERQAVFDKLNTPEAKINRMETAAASYADGINNLTDAQVQQLFAINPFFVKWQKALQYNDIRLSCKQTFGVEYENIDQVIYAAEQTLADVKAKERPLAEKIHNLVKELDQTTDEKKRRELKNAIKIAKKDATKLQRDKLIAKKNIRGVKNLKELEKTNYVNITSTPSKEKNARAVIREVVFDEETGTYKNTGLWDNRPIKMIAYEKTKAKAETAAKEAIIKAGTYTDPITGEVRKPQWLGTDNNVFKMGDGKLVQYRVFELDPLAQRMFSTKQQVNDMVFKILNNGTDGFDLKFVEGVAKLRNDVMKQIEDVAEVAGDGEIENASAAEIEQNKIDLDFLANLIADKDNIKFAENYVRKNLLQMLRPGLLTYKSFDFDPVNYYSMSAKDITQGAFDVGNSRTNKVESGLVNNAVTNVALDQLQWQNNMGIDNNYTKHLKDKIDHNSPINAAINKHTTLAKWSSAITSYLASIYLGINPISALKNEIAGGGGYALTEFNYASSLAGSTYNLAKGFGKNQIKAIGEVRSDFSLFNPKAIGEIADPFKESLPIDKIPNPFLADPERLFNVNRPLSYIAGDNPYSTIKTEGVPYKPIVSDKQLYQMVSDAIHVSNIYNEDPVSGSDIQGIWRGIGQVSFVGMKATEMHLRAFTAFVTADKILREIPFEQSGFATAKEYVDYVVNVSAAVTEAAHGRYNLYDLAPFVRDISGNWLGHNALLLMKPALNMSLNWVQAMRKTGIDISLAATSVEKRKIIFKSIGRLTALMGEMTLLGGVKAIPLITEAAGLLAAWNIAANDGKWSATQQTAIEQLELKSRKMLSDAGLTDEQIDKLRQVFYYGAFSTLVGVNLSMNEGWASYFEPVTIKAIQKLFKDLGKAEKGDQLFEKVGKIAYDNFVPNQLKRITLMSAEFATKKRLDKDFNEIGGELTAKEAIIDGIAGKMLSEVDNTDSMYKFLNATDTDAGKQEYWAKLIKAPNIKIENKGYLADYTDNIVAMSPELLKNTKYAQIAAYKADQEMTDYETTSRAEVQAFIDADLALGDKSTLRAWAEYGKLPDEIKGGSLQSKLKRAMDWSNQYYQSQIAYSILKAKAEAGALVFDNKTISPASITFEVPDAVKNAPDALKGFEYFKYKLEESMGKVERGGRTKPPKSSGKSNFNPDGEFTEPKEYEYKEPNFE